MDCKVCLARFNKRKRRPRVLSCGHTFCSYCITTLIVREKSLLCPNCRKPQGKVTSATDLPINFDMESLCHEARIQDEWIGALCKLVKKQEANIKDLKLKQEPVLEQEAHDVKNKAKPFVDGYYKAIDKKDYEALAEMYSDDAEIIMEGTFLTATSYGERLLKSFGPGVPIRMKGRSSVMKLLQNMPEVTHNIKDLAIKFYSISGDNVKVSVRGLFRHNMSHCLPPTRFFIHVLNMNVAGDKFVITAEHLNISNIAPQASLDEPDEPCAGSLRRDDSKETQQYKEVYLNNGNKAEVEVGITETT